MSGEITYDNNPVIERVIGIQFRRIKEFATWHIGELRQLLKSDYPRIRELEPLDPSFEIFGAPQPSAPVIRLERVTVFQPRIWFISEDDTEVVQFQSDRLVFNWRKRPVNAEYPRYPILRTKFAEVYRKVSLALSEFKLPPIHTNQCEITYINHLHDSEPDNWWTSPEKAVNFFKEISNIPNATPEDARFQIRYTLPTGAGAPHARLIVTGEPQLSMQGAKLYSLNLSVKGSPKTAELDSVMDFLNMGHEQIVCTFDKIATPHAQKLWGKRG